MHLMRSAMRLAMAVVVLATGQAVAQEIKVGGIFDLTGITSDVGKPYAQGRARLRGAHQRQGGVNGKKIKLIDVDYGYKIPEAVSAYKRMKEEQVVLINGWGTGDTLALKNFINDDKIPYFSGSFAGDLTDPAKTPYNFFVAPSYSDQIRAWLSWVKEDWKDKSRAPKVALFYGDNAYGKAPMAAGRALRQGERHRVVDEEILPGNFQDATSQLLNMKQKGADYAYINVTTTGVSLVLKGAKALGLTTKFGSNPYGFSEQLPLVAKEAAEGVTGVMPHVPYGTPVPGMKALEDFHKANHPTDTHDAMYVRGWASATRLGRGAQARRQGRQAHRRGRPGRARDLQGLRPGRPDQPGHLDRHRPPPLHHHRRLHGQGRQAGEGEGLHVPPQARVARAVDHR